MGLERAGTQILTSLRQVYNEYKIIGFIDDALTLQGTKLHGLEVYSPERMSKVITRKNIDMVIMAMPAITRIQRNQI